MGAFRASSRGGLCWLRGIFHEGISQLFKIWRPHYHSLLSLSLGHKEDWRLSGDQPQTTRKPKRNLPIIHSRFSIHFIGVSPFRMLFLSGSNYEWKRVTGYVCACVTVLKWTKIHKTFRDDDAAMPKRTADRWFPDLDNAVSATGWQLKKL